MSFITSSMAFLYTSFRKKTEELEREILVDGMESGVIVKVQPIFFFGGEN
jgi:hypothetical protein